MRCVIIAGGISRRLRPLTDTIPKTLLQLDEKIILEHILDAAISNGLTEFDILTGHGHEYVATFVQQYLHGRPGVRINLHFIERYAETGNIMALLYAEKSLAQDDIVIINSDTIFHKAILQQLLEHPSKNAMVVDDVKTLGEEEMKVFVNADNNIYRIHKSLDPKKAHGEYVGILKFSREMKDKLLASARALMQKDESVYYEDAIQKMIDDFAVPIQRVSTRGLPVMEIDTHEDLAAARELVKEILAQQAAQ